jgi:hypothetical protein
MMFYSNITNLNKNCQNILVPENNFILLRIEKLNNMNFVFKLVAGAEVKFSLK